MRLRVLTQFTMSCLRPLIRLPLLSFILSNLLKVISSRGLTSPAILVVCCVEAEQMEECDDTACVF